MILPVLMMIAFPSPSMEGKWLNYLGQDQYTVYCLAYRKLVSS